MNKRACSILFTFENNFGGEYAETKLIYNTLSKNNNLRLQKIILPHLGNTKLIKYFFWIFKNIIVSICEIYTNRPSIVFTTTFTSGTAAVLIKKLFRLKIIFHYHGDRIPPKNINSSYFHKITQKIKYYLVKQLHDFFIYNVDLIIVPSSFTKRLLQKKFPKIENSKITIVNNGIDIDSYSNLSSRHKKIYRRIVKHNIGKRVVISIGVFNKNKGFEELVECFKHIKNKIKLILLAPRPINNTEIAYKKKIINMISSYNLNNEVRLILGEKSLAPYYHIANLVVSLSNIENLPLTLLESYASGTIYCSKPVGGVTEIIKKINPKLLIKGHKPDMIAKQLSKILGLTKPERNKIIIKQSGFVRNYSIDKTASRIYNLIQELYS